MPSQVMTRILGGRYLLFPDQVVEIADLREKGLPDEAAAILTAVAEKLSMFATLEVPQDELNRMVARSCNLGAEECYKSALAMAREVVGE